MTERVRLILFCIGFLTLALFGLAQFMWPQKFQNIWNQKTHYPPYDPDTARQIAFSGGFPLGEIKRAGAVMLIIGSAGFLLTCYSAVTHSH